ncbi:MAG TPA: AIR synthase related protein, partial [Longimicrobiales bacterium]|nr:AIR synthase related protein [Longimicrobiales bacterium]
GHAIVDCPTYVRDAHEDPEVRRLRAWQPEELESEPISGRPSEALLRLLASPNIASKHWVYDQYDSTVRTATVQEPGGDAGVLRIRGTTRAIAAKTDCNGRYTYLNPRRGAMIAMAEAARNLACVGARPRAITNCLNFGNPLKPHVYHQMKEVVAGMADACRRFETPVVSGNVSLYNESPNGAVFPTPVIGMVGVLDDVSLQVTSGFKHPGDRVVLLGRNTNELGGSEYLKVIHDRVAGDAPAVDLDAEKALQEAVLDMNAGRLLRSAHDCAEGGLAVCLAESAIADPRRPLGFDGGLSDDLAPAALFFGEAQGRVVVTCAPDRLADVLAVAERHGVPAREMGVVGAVEGAFRLRLNDDAGAATTIDVPARRLAEAYYDAIPAVMERAARVKEASSL